MGNYRVRLTRGDELFCHAVIERQFGVTLLDDDGEDIGFVPQSILDDVEAIDE